MNIENLMNSSLDDIEGKLENVSGLQSGTIERYQLARSKKLKNLNPEDLRILIIQTSGLSYIIPLALNLLRENPLICASLYRGDLLFAVLSVRNNVLANNPDWIEQLMEVKFELEIVHKTLSEELFPLLKKIDYTY